MHERYSKLVAGTTIDSGTLLSTDYFNSFNEVIMLLGMVPDMPDILDDVRAWNFRTYQEHFQASGLPFAGLAIEAYAHVPPPILSRFEQTVREIRETVEEAQRTLVPPGSEAERNRLNLAALDYSMRLQRLVDTCSAVVHGAEQVLDQNAVDDLF